ncbi:MAG: hypothetical protein CBD25_000235 [Candidatus Pelagibacter sp. TMED165]|nr:MAG: hypothetical protein CBD25_000235 [Candidatus Pelagibacter sp. TMED165]|tara:strand:- start:245 stop:475 length:231 start_codon:yes stop_codon:yes gene_type:complete
MCVSVKAPSPPPAPEPIPATPPTVAKATTKQKAPYIAESGMNVGSSASNYNRKRLGRGSLRIPLASSGSGIQVPTS